MAGTYCFLSKKGGVGKTTFTLNCAHALAFSGFKVLLVDLDAQNNLTKHLLGRNQPEGFQRRPDFPDISKVLTSRHSAASAIVETGYAGRSWFEVDVATGEPSPWLTFFATRALARWDAAQAA